MITPAFIGAINAFVGGGPGPGSSFVDVVKGDSPDAFWLMNETSGSVAANAMSSSFPGTYSGVTLNQAGLIPSDPTSVSVQFANPSSVLIPGTTTSLSGSAITYMIVFKHKSTPSTYALLGNGISQPYLRVDSNKLDFLKSHVADRLQGSTSLTVGNIYLAHVVVRPGLIALYLNGVLENSITTIAYDYTSNQPFCIGADANGSGVLGEYSETLMSHAAVWANEALTGTQILAHAVAGGF